MLPSLRRENGITVFISAMECVDTSLRQLASIMRGIADSLGGQQSVSYLQLEALVSENPTPCTPIRCVLIEVSDSHFALKVPESDPIR